MLFCSVISKLRPVETVVMATWWMKGKNTRDMLQTRVKASFTKRLLRREELDEEEDTASTSSSSSGKRIHIHRPRLRHNPHHHHHSARCSPATDITTLEVSIESDSSQPVTRIVRPQGDNQILKSFRVIKYFSELPLQHSTPERPSPKPQNKPTRPPRRRDMKRRIQKPNGFKLEKVNPRDYDIKFDTESYLNSDRIQELMNMESLEKTLDEVLTISSDEIDEMISPSRKHSTLSNLTDPLLSSRRESGFSAGKIFSSEFEKYFFISKILKILAQLRQPLMES